MAAREHAVVANHVDARRRDEGAKAGEEAVGAHVGMGGAGASGALEMHTDTEMSSGGKMGAVIKTDRIRAWRPRCLTVLVSASVFLLAACALESPEGSTSDKSDVVRTAILDEQPVTYSLDVTSSGSPIENTMVTIEVTVRSVPIGVPTTWWMRCDNPGNPEAPDEAWVHAPDDITLHWWSVDSPFETRCEFTIQNEDPPDDAAVEWEAQAGLFWWGRRTAELELTVSEIEG
jgi:hypothetical protein